MHDLCSVFKLKIAIDLEIQQTTLTLTHELDLVRVINHAERSRQQVIMTTKLEQSFFLGSQRP